MLILLFAFLYQAAKNKKKKREPKYFSASTKMYNQLTDLTQKDNE
jgi:hypothetical protein